MAASKTFDDEKNVFHHDRGMETNSDIIATNIRALRESLKMSQEAFARMLGVSRGAVGNWELGQGVKLENLILITQKTATSLDRLVTSTEAPTAPSTVLQRAEIQVVGHVGAGADVDWPDDASIDDSQFVVLPAGDQARALIIKGDSQYPRFMPGEVILVAREPSLPSEMVGQYAIVQTLDGRTLIKILRRSQREGHYRLESHNAAPEDDVVILAAWRYLGTLPVAHATLPRARPQGRKA